MASRAPHEAQDLSGPERVFLSIGQIITNSDWVSSSDTDSIGDGSQFNTASQRLLGQRYALKLWPMVYANPSETELQQEK